MDVLARNWGWMALRGVAALAFGALTLLYPTMSVAVLVLFFGAFALVNGIFTIITALGRRETTRSWVALLVSGLLSAIIGVVTFFIPQATALALLYLIAAWAIIIGIGEFIAGVRLRKLIRGEWMFMLAGAISVTFGVLLILFPIEGTLAIALWIGIYAIVLGIILITLAVRLRSWQRDRRADGRPEPA